MKANELQFLRNIGFPMRKKIVIIVLVVLFFCGYLYKYELLFRFQYSRLKGLACQSGDPDFVNDSCLNKIWAHRVNSTGRFRQLDGKFAGVETDITWEHSLQNFLVYHPPFGGDTVKLEPFLAEVNPQKQMVWLDARQMLHEDTTAIIDVLDRFDKIHGLRMNAIIEVYDTTIANFLAERGYWVSLNINTEWIQKFSRDSQWEQLRKSMSPRISFVSQEDIHVPLLKKQFPGKDIITWSLAFENYFNRRHLRELINDDRVKVVLVNIKSRHYK